MEKLGGDSSVNCSIREAEAGRSEWKPACSTLGTARGIVHGKQCLGEL